MNTTTLAILVIASYAISIRVSLFERINQHDPVFQLAADTISWHQKGVNWLIDAQSPNGGWGAGSHANQNLRDPHAVQTDPATTAFAAMTLMEAGGPLNENPYQKQILKALNRILQDIDQRPSDGRITSLTGTQPQVKLGANIDASIALEFLTKIRQQIHDPEYEEKIDTAAVICINMLQAKQNPNGSWADGGWAPVLQSAMANNALQSATTGYAISDSVLIRGSRYQASNFTMDGINVSEGAGVPLYVLTSTQRATAEEAKEAGIILDEAVVTGLKVTLEEKDLSYAIQTTGVKRDKAKRLAKSYIINKSVTKELQKEEIWDGFGSNGGEEYLSYKMNSESLEKQGYDDWLKWRHDIEPKFKQAQNSNGSWSGYHCITSPVFCTAAVLLAWYGDEY
jgi:hypothetical protein